TLGVEWALPETPGVQNDPRYDHRCPRCDVANRRRAPARKRLTGHRTRRLFAIIPLNTKADRFQRAPTALPARHRAAMCEAVFAPAMKLLMATTPRFLALACAPMLAAAAKPPTAGAPVTVAAEGHASRRAWPLTFGVPFPIGAISNPDSVAVTTEHGTPEP